MFYRVLWYDIGRKLLERGIPMHISEMNTIACTVPAEDVARVKGLGCLRDKTTPDCFNCRVLTRNGKITSAESIVIARLPRNSARVRWP